MKMLYEGKTKNVLLDEETNVVHLFFKDDATGENGVFDPGSNTVGGSVAGKGKVGLAVSSYFFELMEANGIPTHYLGSDIEQGLMKVRNLTVPRHCEPLNVAIPLEIASSLYSINSMLSLSKIAYPPVFFCAKI